MERHPRDGRRYELTQERARKMQHGSRVDEYIPTAERKALGQDVTDLMLENRVAACVAGCAPRQTFTVGTKVSVSGPGASLNRTDQSLVLETKMTNPEVQCLLSCVNDIDRQAIPR